jgi:hypothetical protein
VPFVAGMKGDGVGCNAGGEQGRESKRDVARRGWAKIARRRSATCLNAVVPCTRIKVPSSSQELGLGRAAAMVRGALNSNQVHPPDGSCLRAPLGIFKKRATTPGGSPRILRLPPSFGEQYGEGSPHTYRGLILRKCVRLFAKRRVWAEKPSKDGTSRKTCYPHRRAWLPVRGR